MREERKGGDRGERRGEEERDEKGIYEERGRETERTTLRKK